MAEGVVDGLEAVKIQIAHAHRVTGTQRVVQVMEENLPIRKPGQRIMYRLVQPRCARLVAT